MNTLVSFREAEAFFAQLPPYHLSTEERRLLEALQECSAASDALGLPPNVSLQQWAMRRAADESEACLKNVLARLSLPALPPFPPKAKLSEGQKGSVASPHPGQETSAVINIDMHSRKPGPLQLLAPPSGPVQPLTPPRAPSLPPEGTWDCPECGETNEKCRNKCIGCGLPHNSAAKQNHEMGGPAKKQRTAPQIESELQREERIAAFFASLPQDDFTAEELALREALLALLQLKLETNQRYPPAVYECCGSKGDPKITKLKMRLIPHGVPFSDWIDCRVGDEARTSWDDQRRCTVVRLVHEGLPLDAVHDADSKAGKAWKEEEEDSVAERCENNTRQGRRRNRGSRRRFLP